MQQFAKENARMEMTQEMMGDTLDSALDDETTEDDAAELVGQVRSMLGFGLVGPGVGLGVGNSGLLQLSDGAGDTSAVGRGKSQHSGQAAAAPEPRQSACRQLLLCAKPAAHGKVADCGVLCERCAGA